MVVMAGNNVCLTCNFRNPEAMDHVVRDKIGRDDRASGYIERIGGDNMIVGVVELPPPLMSNHLYLDRRISTANILQAKHRVDRASQYQEQEYGRCNRPDNLDGIITMNLPRLRHIGALAIAYNRKDQPSFNEYKDEGCYCQDKPEQVGFLIGNGPSGNQYSGWVAARCEKERG